MADRQRAAFVSGAGRNIGRAIALELAGRGFDVVVNGSRDQAACDAAAAAVRERGADALVAMADMGKPEDIAALTEAAVARFGGIDVVVNNAAIRPAASFLQQSEEDWDRVVDVGLNAAIRTSRAFLPGMVDRGWGRIINLTGMHAIRGYAGRAAVSVAKHGLWGLTKALGREFAGAGITVNAISPGPIKSDHSDPAMAGHNEAQIPQIPTGRLGTPEEVAALAGFLCSEEGAFVNAQMIGVNGGMQT